MNRLLLDEMRLLERTHGLLDDYRNYYRVAGRLRLQSA